MFCTKNGLTARDIKEEVKVLAKFGIKLEHKESNKTAAYTNLRWRTNFEKFNDNEKKNEKLKENAKKGENKGANNVKKFIKVYLVKCSFDTDFVLANVLQERYDQY
jgi:hypothetical protein